MNNLLAGTLNENLGNIVTKLNTLMDSFWIYVIMALAAVVVIWGAYVGIKIAVAHRNEEKINARGMVKKSAYRHRNHLRNRGRRAAAHKRLVGMGRHRGQRYGECGNADEYGVFGIRRKQFACGVAER